MLVKCKFNPVTDIEEAVPDLSISIEEALTTGVVKDTADSTPYTKETDVNAVGHYLHDTIDVAMALKGLNKSLSSMPTSSSVAAPTSEEAK